MNSENSHRKGAQNLVPSLLRNDTCCESSFHRSTRYRRLGHPQSLSDPDLPRIISRADIAISTEEMVRLDVCRPQSSRVEPLSLFTDSITRLIRMLPVLHLDPVLRSAATIGPVPALRYQTFHPLLIVAFTSRENKPRCVDLTFGHETFPVSCLGLTRPAQWIARHGLG